MTAKKIRVATRHSRLALWQANYVKRQLEHMTKNYSIELVPMATTGDKWRLATLSKVGGKGLFMKELEEALLDYRADIAVHSMKDVTMTLPTGLMIGAICPRQDPTDALLSHDNKNFLALSQGAVVGTSSLRRTSQLKALRTDLNFQPLRGNVQTRLRHLDSGSYDAIILASIGLERLGLGEQITEKLSLDTCLPAVGQGAIGIECRESDQEVIELLAHLNDEETAICLDAERSMNRYLNGGCQVPVAGYAVLQEASILLKGLVAAPDGSVILRSECSAPIAEAKLLGAKVADELLSKGAKNILQAIGDDTSQKTS